jgi:hypothetical protein
MRWEWFICAIKVADVQEKQTVVQVHCHNSPPLTRFPSSGIGLAKENVSCETDNRVQEIKKICILCHQCMVDSFHFTVKKMYFSALVLDTSGLQFVYWFQLDIIIVRLFSSDIIHK